MTLEGMTIVMNSISAMQLLAEVGGFPAAFAVVYVVGGVAAAAIGFLALKKAREVNAASVEQRDVRDDD